MRAMLLGLLLVPMLVGCGVPQKVKEAARLGEERAKAAGNLVRSGTVSFDECKEFILAEERLWTALRQAVEE